MGLHQKLSGRGLDIVAFPCNQFMGQEPGEAQEIQSTLDRFGVKFPVMSKSDVNGPDTHEVYQFLKGKSGSDIRWNFFSKFLVHCPKRAKQCSVSRYDGAPNPLSLERDIESMLEGK